MAFGTIILKESPADKWTFKKRYSCYGDTTVKDYGNMVFEIFYRSRCTIMSRIINRYICFCDYINEKILLTEF